MRFPISSLFFSSPSLTQAVISSNHAANERTLLAWSRTGLAFIGAGTGLFTAYNLTFDSDTEVAKVIEEQKSGRKKHKEESELHVATLLPVLYECYPRGILKTISKY